MTPPALENRILFCAALAYQANEQYRNEGTFVVPQDYRVVTRLGNHAYPHLGYVIASRTTAAIVFRGTMDVFDLIRDIDWKLVPNPLMRDGGRTHSGFTLLYEQVVRAAIHVALRKLAKRRKLLIVGHSLGGALAALAAQDVVAGGRFHDPFVCTFASPKTGDAAFAAAYNRMIRHSVRAVNRYDLVPRYPLRAGLQAYMHVHTAYPLDFMTMSVFQNHKIDSYFRELALRDPELAEKLRKRQPWLCPPD